MGFTITPRSLFGISKLYICMNSNLNHAVSWPCMTFGNIAGIVILNSVFKVFTVFKSVSFGNWKLKQSEPEILTVAVVCFEKKKSSLTKFGA